MNRPDPTPWWALPIVLVALAGMSWGVVVAIRRHPWHPPEPKPAVVKCPYCGKDVELRVVKAEEGR